jgi:hypothetical protein
MNLVQVAPPWTGPYWDVPDGIITLDYSIVSNDSKGPAMWLLRDAQRSWDYVNGQTASDPGSTVLAWENNQDCYPGHVCISLFWGGLGGPFIFIQHGVRFSRDTVIHEIGHNYMNNVTQGHYWYPYPSCWGHDIWMAKDAKCAWSEGWADFFPLLVNGDRCYDKGVGPCTGTRDQQYFDLENQGWSDTQTRGPTVEGRVAGALYDLYDSNNEGPFDIATNSFVSMWIIMRDRPTAAQTLADFGNSWKNTGYNYGQFLLVSYQNTIDYGLRWNYLPLIRK